MTTLRAVLDGPLQAEKRSIHLLCWILVALELFALSGLSTAPHSAITAAFEFSFFGVLQGAGRIGMFAMMYVCAGAPFRGMLTCLVLALAGTLLVYQPFFALDFSWSNAGNVVLQFFGAAALAHVAWIYSRTTGERKAWAARLLVGYFVAWLLSLAAPCLLIMTSSLHPATHDLELYKLDAAFGFLPSVAVGLWLQNAPGPINMAVNLAYTGLPIAMTALYGYQLSKPQPPPVRVLNIMVLGGAVVAGFGYHLLPISGPVYVFAGFPGDMPSADAVPLALAIIDQAPRNGMPSMHFGWALAMLILSFHAPRWSRYIFGAVFVLTVVATLGKGEHYLVDLVVSWPVMTAIFALASERLPWTGIRQQSLLIGAALYFGWLLLFWFGIPVLIDWPLLIWIPTILTILVCINLLMRLHRENAVAAPLPPVAVQPAVQAGAASGARVYGLFVLSGFAALIYQVLFSKQLAHVFGSMSAATNTVLATYMAGMAIGAWIGGVVAPRVTRPLLVYAACEFAIALYCALTPAIFDLTQAIYVGLAAGNTPDADFLLPLRLFLGGAGLAIPTVLMGMTLPLLARFFEQRRERLGTSVAQLYAANTLGAAFGALSAGYWIIPFIGLQKTTMLAVAANLMVALLGLRLQKDTAFMSIMAVGGVSGTPGADPVKTYSPRFGYMALVVLMVGGFVTLGLEVEFIHLLAVAAGNSTYAFSLMLFAFLIGLGGGGQFGRWLLQRYEPKYLVVYLELALAAVILAGAAQVDSLPDYFAAYGEYTIPLGFGAREMIRALVCVIIMAPPAFFIGALFPVAVQILESAFPGRSIRMLGFGSALNTVGNIAGVLIAGFILLPMIGALSAIQVMAMVCLGLAVFAAWVTGQWRRKAAWLAVSGVLALALVQPSRLDFDNLTTGANVYFRAQQWGKVLDHAESLDGGLTTVNKIQDASGAAVLTLLTNGKFQGNNSRGGEMVAQAGFALAPLMHVQERESALVIGYGTGNTSHILQLAGFKKLDIAELSPDIYTLADRYFGDINGRVSQQAGVHPYVTDGRNFLLLTDKKYDLVSMEISSIWFAGAAALYSYDFYTLAARALRQDGVLQQWMQIHHASPMDLLYVVGSIRAVFRYVWVYFIGGQAIIVASQADRTDLLRHNRSRLESLDSLSDLRQLSGGSFSGVEDSLILRPDEVDKMLGSQGLPASFFVSTDDNMYLEYSTPKGNALDSELSRRENLAFLLQYSSNASRFLVKDDHADQD